MLDAESIEVVQSVKSLGIIFHENMLWDLHIDKVRGTLSRITGMLSRIRFFVPPSVKMIIYTSLFLSNILYGHLVWGTTTNSNTSKLMLLQKKVVRIVADAPYDAHTAPIFKSLSITPVNDLYRLQLLRRYRTCLKNKNTYLNTIADLSLKKINYPTRNTGIWNVPHSRTNYGFQMLRYQLPQLLNTSGVQ